MTKKVLTSDGLLYYNEKMKAKLSEKVDKVEGKGLSTNDLTNELLTKINNAGDSSFTGNYNDLTNKPTIPTKVSDLTNDSGFQTQNQVNSLINAKVASVMTYKGTVSTMADLPTNASVGDTYNITQAGANNNAGDNVAWNGTAWDVLSGTIDLSEFIKDTELVAITNNEIDAMLAEE